MNPVDYLKFEIPPSSFSPKPAEENPSVVNAANGFKAVSLATNAGFALTENHAFLSAQQTAKLLKTDLKLLSGESSPLQGKEVKEVGSNLKKLWNNFSLSLVGKIANQTIKICDNYRSFLKYLHGRNIISVDIEIPYLDRFFPAAMIQENLETASKAFELYSENKKVAIIQLSKALIQSTYYVLKLVSVYYLYQISTALEVFFGAVPFMLTIGESYLQKEKDNAEQVKEFFAPTKDPASLMKMI